MVEERVKTMKDYLLEIAGVPPSEDTPPPHLEEPGIAWRIPQALQESILITSPLM